MCGEEHTPSSAPRIGARVDFFAQGRGPVGNLLFLDPSVPGSSRATHIRFSPRAGVALDDGVLVSIHLIGDLTKPVEDSGLFQRFALPQAASLQRGDSRPLEMALDESLSLDVGRTGIIGRRVSMTRKGVLLADGIVGFNTASAVSASL
ncbi:hypothetical protein B0T26DRAFT_868862 [Lasiosphaeria miniovina]|uniref:Uncharacterized protein n=1 Tax=Lasiosphaeria miniovina TaxID=1954250 RepID=A0AA40B4K7_9PEZI|nr:uncharacterized protein B0T26DRAFT_868862 [Lasiosphaeria miniovina]KAK0727604.1 hypothetical protein B0T26DRAFT_868862 [Lasiosphaeria miniovina]